MRRSDLRVTTTELLGPQLQRLGMVAIGMTVLGAVLSAVQWMTDAKGFFPSYVFAYLFWIGATTGSMALLQIHHAVGGGWSYVIRRQLEAATRNLPVMALLFIPIVIGMLGFGLYEWHSPNSGGDSLGDKGLWLNPPFWIARTLVYFIFWGWLIFRLNSFGNTQNERTDAHVASSLALMGARELLAYCITITLAGVDWVMSLTPHWYSTLFGMLFIVSQGLTTLALMLFLFGVLAGDKPLVQGLPTGYFRDLGNLTLAFVMLWAYMSFSQYMLTFTGNLREEVVWYLARNNGGWGRISLLLIAFHFALPFLILLVGSNIKRDPRRLAQVALFIVIMRFVDIWWWVKPTFSRHVAISWADVGAPLLIGGIWLAAWAWQMKDRPLVPLYDPRIAGMWQEVVEHG